MESNATYYGKKFQGSSIIVGENMGVSPLTGKNSKSKKSTGVKAICFLAIILYPLINLQPVSYISMLRSRTAF